MTLLTEDQQKLIEEATEYSRISPFPRPTDHINSLLSIIQLQQQVIEKACGQRDTYIMLYDGPLRNFSATKYECDLALQKIMRGTDEQS